MIHRQLRLIQRQDSHIHPRLDSHILLRVDSLILLRVGRHTLPRMGNLLRLGNRTLMPRLLTHKQAVFHNRRLMAFNECTLRRAYLFVGLIEWFIKNV